MTTGNLEFSWSWLNAPYLTPRETLSDGFDYELLRLRLIDSIMAEWQIPRTIFWDLPYSEKSHEKVNWAKEGF